LRSIKFATQFMFGNVNTFQTKCVSNHLTQNNELNHVFKVLYIYNFTLCCT
jgi:hypothetical protein